MMFLSWSHLWTMATENNSFPSLCCFFRDQYITLPISFSVWNDTQKHSYQTWVKTLASLLRKAGLADMEVAASSSGCPKSDPQNLGVPSSWHSQAGTGQPTTDHREEQRGWPSEASLASQGLRSVPSSAHQSHSSSSREKI